MARVGLGMIAVVSVIPRRCGHRNRLRARSRDRGCCRAGVLVLCLPSTVVVWRARAHRRATRVVWPDVVDHLVSAVRSGLALPDSVVTLAHSGPPITRTAFSDFERDYRMTGAFAPSLDRLKDRLADPVADRIIETLRMSREVGGNELTVVLHNLATYLRQDAAIRSEVEARQSWIVNAARLGVAAPWIVTAPAVHPSGGGAGVQLPRRASPSSSLDWCCPSSRTD